MAKSAVKFDKKLKSRYLAELRSGSRRGVAAKNVGVDRATVLNHQKKDSEFAAACIQAEADACDIVEDIMWKKILEKQDNVLILTWLYNRSGDRWQDKRFYREPDKTKEKTVEELKAEMKKRGLPTD